MKDSFGKGASSQLLNIYLFIHSADNLNTICFVLDISVGLRKT